MDYFAALIESKYNIGESVSFNLLEDYKKSWIFEQI